MLPETCLKLQGNLKKLASPPRAASINHTLQADVYPREATAWLNVVDKSAVQD